MKADRMKKARRQEKEAHWHGPPVGYVFECEVRPPLNTEFDVTDSWMDRDGWLHVVEFTTAIGLGSMTLWWGCCPCRCRNGYVGGAENCGGRCPCA